MIIYNKTFSMKTHKYIWVALVLLVLTGCKNDYGKIIEAKKQILYAGVKNAPNHIRYTVRFELYKPVSLDEVSVKSQNNSVLLEHLTIKDLKNGVAHSDLEAIPPGQYLLTSTIAIPDLAKADRQETLVFKIKLEGQSKLYTLTAPVILDKPVYMP